MVSVPDAQERHKKAGINECADGHSQSISGTSSCARSSRAAAHRPSRRRRQWRRALPAVARATFLLQSIARARHRISTASAAATRLRFERPGPRAIELSGFSWVALYDITDTYAIHSPATAALRPPCRHVILFRQVGEPRHVGLALQRYRSVRALALLADHALAPPFPRFHFSFPLQPPF